MKYIGLVMGESIKLVTPVGQQLAPRPTTSFPASTISLRLRITSLAQGWRMGLLRSARGWVGCLPVTRYSSLVTCGRDGSCCTGLTLALRAAGKKPVATPHARSGRAGRVTFSGALETQSISLWAASHSWLGHAPIGSTDIAAAGGALAKTS